MQASEEILVFYLGRQDTISISPRVGLPQFDVVVHTGDQDLVCDISMITQPLGDQHPALSIGFYGMGLRKEPLAQLARP